jgi:hypothetical protein
MKTKATFVPSGFAVTSFIQLYPPAAVSALALCSDIQRYRLSIKFILSNKSFSFQAMLWVQHMVLQ